MKGTNAVNDCPHLVVEVAGRWVVAKVVSWHVSEGEAEAAAGALGTEYPSGTSDPKYDRTLRLLGERKGGVRSNG